MARRGYAAERETPMRAKTIFAGLLGALALTLPAVAQRDRSPEELAAAKALSDKMAADPTLSVLRHCEYRLGRRIQIVHCHGEASLRPASEPLMRDRIELGPEQRVDLLGAEDAHAVAGATKAVDRLTDFPDRSPLK